MHDDWPLKSQQKQKHSAMFLTGRRSSFSRKSFVLVADHGRIQTFGLKRRCQPTSFSSSRRTHPCNLQFLMSLYDFKSQSIHQNVLPSDQEVRKCFSELRFINSTLPSSFVNQSASLHIFTVILQAKDSGGRRQAPLWTRSGVEGQIVTELCFALWIANNHLIVWLPFVVRPSSSFTAPSNNRRNSPSPITSPHLLTPRLYCSLPSSRPAWGTTAPMVHLWVAACWHAARPAGYHAVKQTSSPLITRPHTQAHKHIMEFNKWSNYSWYYFLVQHAVATSLTSSLTTCETVTTLRDVWVILN